MKLGYVEQLYTFGDRGRHAAPGDTGPHLVSVGYLALTRISDRTSEDLALVGARWRRWYEFFPWEDWREGRPAVLDDAILPALRRWSRSETREPGERRALGRRERIRLAFGEDNPRWDEERALDRYELLYEAGLVDRGRARRANDLRPQGDAARPARRCASTTGAFWRPPSRACAPS